MLSQAHGVQYQGQSYAVRVRQVPQAGHAYDDATNWAGLLAQRGLVACKPVLPQPLWAHAYVQVHLYEQSPNQQACNTAQQPKLGAAKLTVRRSDEQAGLWLEQMLAHNKCTFNRALTTSVIVKSSGSCARARPPVVRSSAPAAAVSVAWRRDSGTALAQAQLCWARIDRGRLQNACNCCQILGTVEGEGCLPVFTPPAFFCNDFTPLHICRTGWLSA